jgi:DHA1 family tetracycline resistance protein-like MFS transporter
LFKNIHGNAKWCVIWEPLFVVPWSLFSTYATVYMLALGINATQIGIITTLGLVMQIFSTAISGYLTDRLGRRKALWIFDVVAWTFATIIWALSSNFWWFLVAALFNSFQRIPATAWYCLLVEDTKEDERTHVFTGLQIVGMIGGIFAPIGGVLVANLGLIQAERWMYIFACIGMSLMIFLRHITIYETDIGKRKMEESKQKNWKTFFYEYRILIKEILGNKILALLFLVYVLWNFQLTIRTTYQSIFFIDFLHASNSSIAWLPAVSSVAMFILMKTMIPKFREENAKFYMIVGFIFQVASLIILLAAPSHQFTWIIVSTVLMAIGAIIASPYLESTVANAIDDEKRADALAVLNVFILIGTAPAGIIGGYTYALHATFPFYIVMTSLVVSICLLLYLKQMKWVPQSQLTSNADL